MAVLPAVYRAARASLEGSASAASMVLDAAAPPLVSTSAGAPLQSSSTRPLLLSLGQMNMASLTTPSLYATNFTNGVRATFGPASAYFANEESVENFKISAMAIAIVAAVSTLMVFFLILQLIPSFVVNRNGENRMDKVFIKTQLGMYTFCLLISNLLQGIGGVLELVWALRAGSVELLQTMSVPGLLAPFLNPTVTCSAQAYLLQMGDVATATWACVIAVHTFKTLVLRRKSSFRTVFLVISILWTLIIFDTLVGPLILQKPGVPFYGPVFTDDPAAPLWCWITVFYPTERFATHYVLMLISAVASSVLYALVYLALRSRSARSGIVSFQPDWSRYEMFVSVIARRMLLYPLAYVALILPISLCRFFSTAGFSVPFWAWITSACIVALTGLINGILLIWTSKVVQPSHWRMLLYFRRRSELADDSFNTFVQPSFPVALPDVPATPRRPPLATIITNLPPEKADLPTLEKVYSASSGSVSDKSQKPSSPTKRKSIAETVNTFFSTSPLRLLPTSPIRIRPASPFRTRAKSTGVSLQVPSPKSSAARGDRTSRQLTLDDTEKLLSRFPLPPPATLPSFPTRPGSLSRKSIEAMFAALPAEHPRTSTPPVPALPDRSTLRTSPSIPGTPSVGLPAGPASMRAEMLRRRAEKLQLPSPQMFRNFRNSEDGHSFSSITPLASPLPDDASDLSPDSVMIDVRHISIIHRPMSMRSSRLDLEGLQRGQK